MSTGLFHINILEVAGAVVLVEVTDTYEGISPPETATFFFAALYEPASGKAFPISDACSDDDMCDEDFVEEHVTDYIVGVEVNEVASAAKATYRVQFTDAKWAKHLRPGLAWGTESYDIGEPVLRSAIEAAGKRAPVAPKRGAKSSRSD
jgi:hypothetical protein